jgi:hypothetical protein
MRREVWIVEERDYDHVHICGVFESERDARDRLHRLECAAAECRVADDALDWDDGDPTRRQVVDERSAAADRVYDGLGGFSPRSVRQMKRYDVIPGKSETV